MKKILIMLLSVLSAQSVFAQTISVSGIVTDSSGLPVIGAVVAVKGSTTNASVTDIDGNYSLSGVPSSE